MINILLNFLLAMFIILAIIILLGLSYASIWVFLFSPIKQLDKRNERLAEANREYNKIEVEHAKMVNLNEEQKKVYDKWSVKKQQLIDEVKETEKELKRKQGVLAEVDIKLSTARSKKTTKKSTTA
jgi:predicted membrane protein